MKKFTCLAYLVWLCGIVCANAQGAYVKKSGVSPSFLTKHGVYYSIEDTHSYDLGVIFHSLLFYNDGTFYIGGHNFDSRISMFRILDDLNYANHDQSNLQIQDAWGSYYISNDTIYMQRFSFTPGNEFSTKTTGMIAIVKSDSSFNMIKETCDWCGINEYFGPQGHVYEKPISYKFYRLDRLPDASFAWFRKKAWFIEGNSDQNTIAAVR